MGAGQICSSVYLFFIKGSSWPPNEAAPAHARLKIFDAAGRLVTTLVDEQRAAGRHEVVWNGQNASGQSVASCVYLYRFEAGSTEQTRRMTLVK